MPPPQPFQGLGETFDLLVIGGGINGAGIAKQAAMQGLSVCLLEKDRFGQGTSAKSSMLAHGGVRYLEQFEFRLVHEALQEREKMLKEFPHLVKPLRFVYPIYPHVASRRTVRVGLWLYDLLSHGKSLPKRQYLKRAEVLQAAPGLNPDRLSGGATYYDCLIEDVPQLVRELVLAAGQHGATCLEHATVTELLMQNQPRPGTTQTQRRCTGARVLVDGKEGVVRARAVVNATGPWLDDLLGFRQQRPPLLRRTKGIHLVVPRFVEDALIVKAASDERTFFVIPWKDHCLIGTTDTDFEGDPGDAAATDEDIAYLVDEARRYFPNGPLGDIQWTYAGVRPLVNEEGLVASSVTRRHKLYDHGKHDGVHGLWSLQGGKLTTYRSFGEMVVGEVRETLRSARASPKA